MNCGRGLISQCRRLIYDWHVKSIFFQKDFRSEHLILLVRMRADNDFLDGEWLRRGFKKSHKGHYRSGWSFTEIDLFPRALVTGILHEFFRSSWKRDNAI